jgi:hypothetical protein
MPVSKDTFAAIYHRLNQRFDREPTDTVRDCYDRIMAYGRRKDLIPWFLR